MTDAENMLAELAVSVMCEAFSLLFYHLFLLKFVAYFVAKTDIGCAFDCVMSCQKINVHKKCARFFFSQTVTLAPCVRLAN